MRNPVASPGRSGRRRFRQLAAAAGLLALAGGAPGAGDRLTRVGGEVVEDRVVALAGDSVTLGRATIALDEVWRIARAAEPAATVPGAVERVMLRQGEIPARALVLEGATCRFDWDGGQGVALPRAAIRALVFAAGATPAAREALARALDKHAATDVVLALSQDQLPLPVAGSISAIDANSVTIGYQGQDRSLPRRRTFAVIFGSNDAAPPIAARLAWKIVTTSGAWMEGERARLANDVLTVDFGGNALEIPWDRVCRLEYRSPRLRFLSELEPTLATQDVVVTLPLPWQRNRNAMGRPLRLQGKMCDRGLGLHAPAALVFTPPANARRFMALVGLDEEYGRGGDCVVIVQAGEREVFRERLRGGEPPRAVDVELPPGGRLTLRAEAGENYDLGDHVNWYEARLLVNP